MFEDEFTVGAPIGARCCNFPDDDRPRLFDQILQIQPFDAGMMADEYTLAYQYTADLSRIEWHLVKPSSLQKSQTGSYDIVGGPDGIPADIEIELVDGV